MGATDLWHRREFAALRQERRGQITRGSTSGASPSSNASRVADGNTSLVDCPMLTWSFGLTLT